jgi:hypothetical protein
MPSDVFISHSPSDAATAGKMCEFLEGHGVRCWLSPRDVLPGEEQAAAIKRGIAECPIMVLIFSQSANDSDSIRNEVESAVTAQKVLIPFRIENVAPDEAMEPYFRRRYWHDAHTPPLERHLEELTRMLKPLAHKYLSNLPEDASISRTLPSRSSIVRGGGGAGQPLRRESDGPLGLSFNFNHVVVTGCPSPFELTVENAGTEILEQIEIVLESRGLKRAIIHRQSKLAPGAQERYRLEVEPFRSGHFVLQVTAKWRTGSRQFSAVGSRSFRVNETPTPADLAGGVKNLVGNSDKPGVPVGFVPDLGEFLDAGTVYSLGALLNMELPENFERLDLTRDYEVDLQEEELANVAQSLQIPENFLGLAQEGTLLALEALGTPTASPHQEIRLVGKPSFNLGRLREESDFLLWFWPRNQIHDTKTRRISKKHCTLTAKGGKLYVENVAAASLTTFDGQEVTGAEGVPLERRGILNLSGIYFLDVTRFPSAHPQGPTIANLEAWRGTKSTPPSIGSGSVRFMAVTPHVLPQNSSWLLSDATFGTSRINPVILKLDGLAEIQGRFHHYRGGFWVENVAGNSAVMVNGEILPAGSIAPLVDGQVLQLGGSRFSVTVSA